MSLIAETKEQVELRRIREQLAATQAALKEEREHSTALQKGTQKLTEAVVAGAETTKETSKIIADAADKIVKSEEGSKALVETVKSSAKETQANTKNAAASINRENNAAAAALAIQLRQQERANLNAAKEVAKKLEKSNEDGKKVQREYLKKIAELTDLVTDLKRKAEVSAAANQTVIRQAELTLYGQVAVPVCGVIGTIFGVVMLVLQARFKGDTKTALTEIAVVQEKIHTQVNGNLSEAQEKARKLEVDNRLLRQQIDSLLSKS